MKKPRKEITPAKRLRFRLEYFVARSLEWLVPKFPRHWIRQFGRGLGWLAFQLAREARRIALANLDLAFGDTKTPAEKYRIARESLQSGVVTVLTLFWAPRLTREIFDDLVDMNAPGLAEVRALKAAGRPIVFVTAHYGDWELLGLGTGYLGIPVTIIQEKMRNEPIEQVLARLRSVSGHALLPNKHVARTLLKTLQRGGNIALLIDLNSTRRRGGVWLDFFGRPVFSSAAAGALALHTGAAIVPGMAHPLSDGRTRFVFGPAIEPNPTGDPAADQLRVNQQCLTFCEQAIRENPTAWLWNYKRWKYRPTPDSAGYPFYAVDKDMS